MKSKKVYIIIAVVLLIIVFGAVGLIYYKKNYPKVKSIEITQRYVKLTEGVTFELELTIKPKNAKNKDVVWSSNNKNVVKVSRGEITAVSSGEAKVCAKIEKTDIEDCINISITSKKEKILERLKNAGYKETVSNQKYTLFYDNSTYIFDLSARTFTSIYKSDSITINYVYHYDQNYIDGYSISSGYRADYFYNTLTKNLSCVGGTVLYHQYACSYSSNQSTKISMDSMVNLFNSYIEDYSVEDLY